jgi:catechol 2,3-dioxygenase-like lactoylglutathione lyase family enzyme
MTVHINLIGMISADMPATLAFYRRLGLDIPAEADTEPHVEVTLPGGLRLAWDDEATIKSIYPDWTAPSSGHRMNLAFLCDSPANVDELFTELTDAGYRELKKPWDAFWGQRYAVVHDPDGNPTDLFAPLDAG